MLRPILGSHFSDSYHKSRYTQSFSQHSVLFGLSILIKSSFELAFFSRDYKNGNISLTGTHDHVRYVVFVSWGIEDCESSVLKREVKFGVFDSFTSLSFVRINVSNTGQLPCLHMILLGLLFISCPLLFINFTELFHNVSGKCWFTSIDVTDENDVDILLFELVNIDIFILWPLGSHEGLNIDFRISLSDDYLFFFFNWGLFNLGDLFFLLRLICLLFLFIEFKIVSGLLLL